jgi:hypothetical protein
MFVEATCGNDCFVRPLCLAICQVTRPKPIRVRGGWRSLVAWLALGVCLCPQGPMGGRAARAGMWAPSKESALVHSLRSSGNQIHHSCFTCTCMTDPTSSTQPPKLIKPSCGFPAKWLIQHCPSSCHNAPKSLLCWRSLSYIAYNIFPTIAKTCQRLTFLMNSQVSGRFVIFPTTTNIYHVLDIAFDLLTKTAEPTCSQLMPTTISILSLPLIVLRNG